MQFIPRKLFRANLEQPSCFFRKQILNKSLRKSLSCFYILEYYPQYYILLFVTGKLAKVTVGNIKR